MSCCGLPRDHVLEDSGLSGAGEDNALICRAGSGMCRVTCGLRAEKVESSIVFFGCSPADDRDEGQTVLLESINVSAPIRRQTFCFFDIRVLRHLGQLCGLRLALAR